MVGPPLGDFWAAAAAKSWARNDTCRLGETGGFFVMVAAGTVDAVAVVGADETPES